MRNASAARVGERPAERTSEISRTGNVAVMIVVACNTASAAALPVLSQSLAPLPVVGVIEPGAAAAVAH